MQPRIYTYKITFEEVPYWYWGVHKEKKFGESYFGSPVTHQWVWDFYTPKLQILEIFTCDDKGWGEAGEVEKRLILPDLNNPFCLNENCAGQPSLACLRKGGAMARDLGLGIFAEGGLDPRAGGLATFERKLAIFSEKFRGGQEYKDAVKKGGQTVLERKLGIFSVDPKERLNYSRLGANVTNSLKYRCTVTGKVLPPGPLACWQRHRGIDPSNRELLE